MTKTGWNRAGEARRNFADMVEGLSDEQLAQQTLCNEWDARGVLGHVTAFVENPLPKFMGIVAMSGFNFDKATLKMAKTQSDRPIADVLASLRSKADQGSPMPMFPEELTMTDTAIHTQDVRRPLGLAGELSPDLLRTSLDFLTTHKQATMLVNRPSIENVALRATDIDWSWGAGDEISGTAEALMMGLANRPVLDELAGPGVSHWH